MVQNHVVQKESNTEPQVSYMAALILKCLRKKPLINDGVKVLFAFHLVVCERLIHLPDHLPEH